jgi:hypothetical protein
MAWPDGVGPGPVSATACVPLRDLWLRRFMAAARRHERRLAEMEQEVNE